MPPPPPAPHCDIWAPSIPTDNNNYMDFQTPGPCKWPNKARCSEEFHVESTHNYILLYYGKEALTVGSLISPSYATEVYFRAGSYSYQALFWNRVLAE